MPQISLTKLSASAIVLICLLALLNLAHAEEPVQFNRDIRPILANHCFQCHGPDANSRDADLRLDLREQTLTPTDSGETPITPGHPETSDLIHRISTDDTDLMMPPEDFPKPLSGPQKDLLSRWIAEGAKYEKHWAFVTPEQPTLPEVQQTSWPRNGIDHFVLARLEKEELEPSPETDLNTLIRRLSLDLTGLPPKPADVTLFVKEMKAASSQQDADAVYSKWVDRLLVSPHYGERMAVDWLDAARFADSNGYQVDRDREMYAWRDWVINAFNSNKPFDQFTIEQLAGDLLPNATFEQKVATGFNRNHMMNEEGGIIPEEFLTEYCADRVETTATIWLGQTFNCCRCHDHKYDPFTQRDYYSLFAFFHNVTEKGVGDYGANIRRNSPPFLKLPAPEVEAKLVKLNEQLDQFHQQHKHIRSELTNSLSNWETKLKTTTPQWTSVRVNTAKYGETGLSLSSDQHEVSVLELTPGFQTIILDISTAHTTPTALTLEFTSSPDIPFKDIYIESLKLLSTKTKDSKPTPLKVHAAEIGNSLKTAELAKALDGNKKTEALLKPNTPVSIAIELEPTTIIRALRIELEISHKEKSAPFTLKLSTTETALDLLVPTDVHHITQIKNTDRTPEQQKQLVDFRTRLSPEYRNVSKKITALKKQIVKTDLEIPTTLVMQEMETKRPTHILMRGVYDKKGETVTTTTPAILPAMKSGLPPNRLGLAQWLVSSDNPLTARVTVNRFWQSLFGTGLVETSEDFGTQGDLPSHPELLDYLAIQFQTNGWDIKAILKLIVTSATYRQSSRMSPSLVVRDPQNRLLARGSRLRLSAEMIRDQALAASGLLVTTLGGPSVKPYHPPGLYEQVVAGSSAKTYVVGKGDELYRRSMYTYWKRSVPNPGMLVFDAPFRETCAVRRSRTNTPLQALNLMNDPTYIEAARSLAQRMTLETGSNLSQQIIHGFQLVLARAPRPAELSLLTASYQRQLHEFQQDTEGSSELIKVGDTTADSSIDPAHLAALTTIASTILNLDESITKE